MNEIKKSKEIIQMLESLNNIKSTGSEFTDLKGAKVKGVCSAKDFLTFMRFTRIYESQSAVSAPKQLNIMVFGDGDSAISAALTARKLGAEVTVIFGNTEENFKSINLSVTQAKKEGISFRFLTRPLEIFEENGFVSGIGCQEMMPVISDKNKKTEPVPLYDSEFELQTDMVIIAESKTAALEENKITLRYHSHRKSKNRSLKKVSVS